MAVTYKIVEGTALTATNATLYSAPSTVLVSIVRLIEVVNSDTSDRQVQMYKIPPSGSANTASLIRRNSTNNVVEAGKTEQWDTLIFVAPSGTVSGFADSASVVTVHMSILEVS